VQKQKLRNQYPKPNRSIRSVANAIAMNIQPKMLFPHHVVVLSPEYLSASDF